MRVRTDTLDRFLGSVGEVILSTHQLRNAAASAPQGAGLEEGFDQVERRVSDLQRRVLDLRTTPLLRVMDSLPRTARQVAERTGRQVRVELSGAELELDRSILDRLNDPLVHIVRNAVDHGVEPPDEREAAGKDPTGTLLVAARRRRDAIEISVADDGRGIDLAGVLERAVERGVVHRDLAADLPPEEIAALVFSPGLSTAKGVSEVSGRGVGMDAVKATIESLGGSVELRTEPGVGTTTTLVVPITAAVQRVLLVGVAADRVALPIARVERILETAEAALERSGGECFTLVDDDPVLVVDLAERLRVDPGERQDPVRLVMTDVRGERIALRVDRFEGQQEIYVKPVPDLLGGMRALAGLTILGDGSPVFVMDMNHLV